MRSSRGKENAARAIEGESRWAALLAALGWSHRDAVAVAVVGVAIGAVVINALFMQVGPHPAPMFKNVAAPMPEASSTKPDTARASLRASAEIVADIQRELSRRGFFDGVVDGRRSPRTEIAIRDFELAAGMVPKPQPTEELLAAIRRSNVKAAARLAVGATNGATAPHIAAARNDPIAAVLAPSARVVAVQRVLAAQGYGPVKPTGIMDPATRAAIEKFQREHKLPVTGEASDRVVRELAAATGRPVE